MVEYILGNYLVERGKLTKAQLEDVLVKQDATRVKMGLLAVSEGLMTIEQAEKVNKLQSVMDKRFGDIAVEKGYLTDTQISSLLKKQGNSYLSFAQTLVNENLLNLQELEDLLDGFQQENGFSKSDMEDLRSDEPERIIPLFLPPEALCYKDSVGVLVRTLIRLVDRHAYIGKAEIKDEITVVKGAFQKMDRFSVLLNGFRELETGLVEGDGALSEITRIFCKESEALCDEDLLDAAGEFLNCINGLYFSALSRNGMDSELLPPNPVAVESVIVEQGVCVIPVYIKDKQALFTIVGRK